MKPRLLLILLLAVASCQMWGQRRITPVETPATTTIPINELENDTARINARIRASMAHYLDENGNIIYIDTITGREWRDSTAMLRKIPMKYPLFTSASVGIDIWNPIMRAFKQHYGLIDFSIKANLHNRYQPVFETGLGLAKNTPADNNFTYRSPLSTYFRIGCDYNFLYNSTPDYQFTLGLRYGISPFSYSITDITINSDYWGEISRPEIPSQKATAGWWELAIGLRVKLFGPISAGWTFRYHQILHESKAPHGRPWYIPGYGSRQGAITGSFTIYYTLPLGSQSPGLQNNPPET